MKNKTFINIQPQEVTEGGERSVRYKGSDGKLHDITAKQKLPALSIEEKRTSVKITVSDLQTSTLTVNEFLMKYQGTKFADFQIINASYTSSSANKIYFANSIKGTFNYYYDLGNSVVEFRDGNTVLDQMSRSDFSSDMTAVKAFFERTIATIIDHLTPYYFFYFMKNAGMVIKSCRFTAVEQHVIVAKTDGTKTDLGSLNRSY